MANPTDIMSDSNGDDIHVNGDLLVDDCTVQCQKLLLLTNKGTLKHDPTVGIGITTYVLDEGTGEDLKADIQEQFEGDGMRIDVLQVNSLMDIIIDARYV